MGCDVLDRIEKRGFEKGFEEGFIEGFVEGYEERFEECKTEGEDNIRLLGLKLFSLDRIEDWKRAMDDKGYREQLKKEFGIR